LSEAGGGTGPLPASEEWPQELGSVRLAVERAVRTWEPSWTPFLAPRWLHEAESLLARLSDVHHSLEGGYGWAERRRLLLWRSDALTSPPPSAELMGLEMGGNFLFDPATVAEMREGLHLAGASDEEVGDLWLRGDRGAQAVITTALGGWLDGCLGQVRSVEVRFEVRPLAELRFPPQRLARALSSVEASLRVDAVASAGFGLSRSRMAALIRQGALQLDWRPVSSPSQALRPGQRLQLEGRGEVEITSVTPTQRGRWRVAMVRR
jgi:photosystem II S4 domain protein